MYRQTHFGPRQTERSIDQNGKVSLRLKSPLQAYPHSIIERLISHAQNKAEAIFLSRKNNQGSWQSITYEECYKQVRSIAQVLLDYNLSQKDTVAIISENSIEHAMMALACLHIGTPYAPISPAYSLVSNDMAKLKHCIKILNPKLVFVQDTNHYHRAVTLIKSILPHTICVSVEGSASDILYKSITERAASNEVDRRYKEVTGETIAKILFTSGSTGLPKGVKNHHSMWTANLQQITQTFPFMKEELIFVDWLPWNHTFGGNHNFGLVLYNGGSMYIDDGKPSAEGIKETVATLCEISPTTYFNVPKGFEMLIDYLEKDQNMREVFFSKLNMLFYAGASLSQPIWDRLEQQAVKTLGHKIPIVSGLGCTESGPSALFAHWSGAFSGLLGVPVPAMEVKLVNNNGKFEARYKGPNVFKGYWQNEEDTARSFDEEGYYLTGDAVKFLEEEDADQGLIFDGRIAEDFKLSTGTWVNVGVLRAKAIKEGSPIIQDIVLTGLDQDFIGAILFLNVEPCKQISDSTHQQGSYKDIVTHHAVAIYLQEWMDRINAVSSGSSTRIHKYVVAETPPSIDLGEITDKGSINQLAVLRNRGQIIEQIYKK